MALLSATLRDFWEKDPFKLINTDRHANDHAGCTRACALPLLNLKKKRDCSQSPRYFVTITNLYNFTLVKRFFCFSLCNRGTYSWWSTLHVVARLWFLTPTKHSSSKKVPGPFHPVWSSIQHEILAVWKQTACVWLVGDKKANKNINILLTSLKNCNNCLCSSSLRTYSYVRMNGF